MLTCIDVTTEMTTSCVVPRKGIGDCIPSRSHDASSWVETVLRCPTDRPRGLDSRASSWVATYTGRSARQAPAYSGESQGSVERY